jgi:tRNA dimethylallyltransferase
MSVSAKPTVLFVVGPTASGKTDAALSIVDVLRGRGRTAEIVNGDSRQVYRGMSIGTAKSTPEELARAAHHVIDVADPSDGFSLAVFLNLARTAIADILTRGAMPIVVGGTGQYVWGLVEGWQVPEVAPAPEIRARLEAEVAAAGVDMLYQRLQMIDAEAAAFIDPRNVRRLVRALEVIEITGRPFSEQRTKEAPPFDAYVLALNLSRADLYARIDARVDTMLARGWIREVGLLLAAGNTPDMPAFSSAGYREIASLLAGDISIDEAAARTKTATHRLARSQANWFRAGDERISWHNAQEGLVLEAIQACSP